MEKKESVIVPPDIEPKEFIVRIKCMTYNHAPYIEDAMTGFCLQQTKFPFVALIIDDASIDGEAEIIKNYLQSHFLLNEKDGAKRWETEDAYFVFARNKENENCYFAVILLKYNFHSIKKSKSPLFNTWLANIKYIAVCEGDDYWTDPKKLQRQVDFLESHPEYSMCFHAAKVINEEKLPTGFNNKEIENREYSATELFKYWIVPTAAMLYRKEIHSYKIVGNNRVLFGDIMIILKCAHMGKVWGMSDRMSVYRINKGSATQSNDTDRNYAYKYPIFMDFIIENFPKVNKRVVLKRKGKALFSRALLFDKHPSKLFFKDLLFSFYYNPVHPFKLLFNKIKRA
jgi:glycosyltransferase involved in cell wall biosynthesis